MDKFGAGIGAKIILDNADTPGERALKVFAVMGFTDGLTPQLKSRMIAKLTEALMAYRNLDREATAREMTPLVMTARAELEKLRARWEGQDK